MNRLTATLITRDEERSLPRALASLAGVADEIVVVDSDSRDRTCALARQQGARVLERPFTDYSDQKNYAAAQASHDWVLNLDADEELSPALQTELRQWKRQPAKATAYSMPRKARYLGRWIEHSGWYPDRKTRLYRRERARFVGRLHEGVEVDGTTAFLQGDLYHHTFETVSEHFAQINRYTSLAAEELFAAGRRHWLVPLVASPPWMFLRTYVLKQGFRDGYHGWLIAKMVALTSFLKYAKLGALAAGGTLEPEAPPGETPAARAPRETARSR